MTNRDPIKGKKVSNLKVIDVTVGSIPKAAGRKLSLKKFEEIPHGVARETLFKLQKSGQVKIFIFIIYIHSISSENPIYARFFSTFKTKYAFLKHLSRCGWLPLVSIKFYSEFALRCAAHAYVKFTSAELSSSYFQTE